MPNQSEAKPAAGTRVINVLKGGKLHPVKIRPLTGDELKARVEAQRKAEYEAALKAEQDAEAQAEMPAA